MLEKDVKLTDYESGENNIRLDLQLKAGQSGTVWNIVLDNQSLVLKQQNKSCSLQRKNQNKVN